MTWQPRTERILRYLAGLADQYDILERELAAEGKKPEDDTVHVPIEFCREAKGVLERHDSRMASGGD